MPFAVNPGRAPLILAIVVAGVVFWLAFDGGTYMLESRSIVAIAVWWAIVIAVGLGLWPLRRPPRAAFVAGALLAAFAAWTLASVAWAPSAERAFAEFNRASLYLGVYVLAVVAATRGSVARWSDGAAIGLAAVGLLALASRLFPTYLPGDEAIRTYLPSAFARLSYPVNYWNGLAILVALSFPLLLRAAVAAERSVWRGLAIAPLPALAATLYLTSSRGGVATALVGSVAFAALAPRWSSATALGVTAVASAAVVAVLLARPELVDEPARPEAVAQGTSAAILIALICAAAGLIYGLISRFRVGPAPRAALAGRAGIAALVFVALVGLAASDPVRRFETFKEPPPALTQEQGAVKSHLLSGSGSGRWQFWEAAVEEWQQHPLLGRGAGTYEAWWAQHGTLAMFVRDAHSLYLESLGELGIVGFLLLVSAFGTGIVVGARRLVASQSAERPTVAALLALFLAFACAAAIDWMWELTVVSVVGIAGLGLLTGPATAVDARPRLADNSEGRPSWTSRRFALGAAALVLGWLLLSAQAIPLLTQVKIGDSEEAVRRDDAQDAFEDAVAARNLQPWAASPYLQLALVDEHVGELPSASGWIEEAIERDRDDWRLWLVAARIETKMGAVLAARESLARAKELNPRSPLFQGP